VRFFTATMPEPPVERPFSDVEMPDATPPASAPPQFSWRKVAVPVLLGLSAAGYLLYRQYDPEKFRAIEWTARTWAWIGLAFGLFLIRHLFYSLRIHALAGGYFSWRKCLELIVLWEFTCAIAPTSKGGPLAMLYALRRDGLSAGRTATVVFYTILCDSGFFVLLLPVLLLVHGPPMLYPGMTTFSDGRLASGAFFTTYALMVTYWLALAGLLLLRPQVASSLLERMSRWRLLKRWQGSLQRFGQEFALAAESMKQEPWSVHTRVLAGTLGAWTCKFLMINALIIAIVPSTPIDGGTQAFIYARLVAMFIIMAFSPTPGGAGLAEMALVGFTSDFVPEGLGIVVALLWRGMAYYGYLLAGAVVVPRWWSRGR
jgi:glycosyltransferase 2 family protein